MQALGGERGIEGGRHAFGGCKRIKGGLAVAPVEDEGGGRKGRVGPGGVEGLLITFERQV